MQKYSGLAMDTAGNVLGGAAVTVYVAGTLTLATVFSDNAFTPKANPFTAEADGTCFFYGYGRFDVVFNKDGYSFRDEQTTDIFLNDPMSVASYSAGAQQDNYAPLNGTYIATWRLTATSPFTITGIVAGFSGQTLILTNVSASNAITLANASASSTAANQILTGGGDYTLTTNQSVILAYDATSTKWRIVGMTAATSTNVSTGTIGRYGSTNLTGTNNVAAPSTRYDLAASFVTGRNPANGETTIWTNAAVTLDISTAGPAANGRDQAGSLGASSWPHLYWIGKTDGTVASIISATAPPTGPTLPATYTHWAHIGSLRLNASGQLLSTFLRGAWVYYPAAQIVVTDGRALVETAVSVADFVPPTALNWALYMTGYHQTNASHWKIRVTAGQDYIPQPTVATIQAAARWTDTLPNVGQQFFYLVTQDQGATTGLNAYVRGYENPR